MIGRASIGYPWIFREIKHYVATGELLPGPTIQERVDIARRHLEFSLKWKGERLGVLEMRRHYSNYFRGLRHIKAYRSKLVQELDPAIVFELLEEIRERYSEVEFVG